MAGPLAHDPGWTPGEGDLNNGNGISLGVRFIVTEALSLGGISWFAPATNSGTYSYALYTTTSDDDPNGSGTGTLIDDGTIDAASVTPSAWNDLPLPFEAETGVVYTARVHTSSGRFVRTTGAFTSAAISDNGVTLLQVGTDPNPPGLGSMINGVFLDNAVGYPNTRFNDADYGIDVFAASEIEPISMVGAIAVGEPVVSGAAALQLRAAGAISVGEPVVAGVLLNKTPVAMLGAIGVGEPAVSAAVTHPVTEQPSGFGPLLDMFRGARRNAGVRVRATECQYDGWPLESARGVLHCSFCGRTY